VKGNVRYVVRYGKRIELVDTGQRKLEGRQHIGCSVRFLRAAVKATKTSRRLAVALYLYRLRSIRRSKTIQVPNGWLEKMLDISPSTKIRALDDLAAAGLIVFQDRSLREATLVTLLVD
jgi:hypothetical protein